MVHYSRCDVVMSIGYTLVWSFTSSLLPSRRLYYKNCEYLHGKPRPTLLIRCERLACIVRFACGTPLLARINIISVYDAICGNNIIRLVYATRRRIPALLHCSTTIWTARCTAHCCAAPYSHTPLTFLCRYLAGSSRQLIIMLTIFLCRHAIYRIHYFYLFKGRIWWLDQKIDFFVLAKCASHYARLICKVP